MNTLKEILYEHIRYAEPTIKMARADILKTYRGAALGWSWAIINPTVRIFVYWFAMEIGLRNGGDVNGYPYFLWLISGLIPWFYINDMLTIGTNAMRRYHYLVTKLTYPVSTIPTFVSLSKLFVNLVLHIVMLGIFWLMGYPPTIYYIQIPLFMLFSFLFFTNWSLFASCIAAISQDFANLMRSLVFAIFWMSGILYNADNISNPTLRMIMQINPVTYLVTSFRNAYMSQKWFFESPKQLIAFLVLLVIMFLIAINSYKSLRKEIPDEL